MLLTYSISYRQNHYPHYEGLKNGYSFVSESFARTRQIEYCTSPYSDKKKRPKPRWAYSLSYTREFSEKATKVFHSLGDRVRSRFSRKSKPIDHLGGLNPEKRLPFIGDLDRDLEKWPKVGNTFENMDIRVY